MYIIQKNHTEKSKMHIRMQSSKTIRMTNT